MCTIITRKLKENKTKSKKARKSSIDEARHAKQKPSKPSESQQSTLPPSLSPFLPTSQPVSQRCLTVKSLEGRFFANSCELSANGFMLLKGRTAQNRRVCYSMWRKGRRRRKKRRERKRGGRKRGGELGLGRLHDSRTFEALMSGTRRRGWFGNSWLFTLPNIGGSNNSS